MEQKTTDLISGLTYVPNFLSLEDSDLILKTIDSTRWNNDLRRRTQHYGWRYDYRKRSIDYSMALGPLPEWAQKIALELYQKKFVPFLPDQVIVNEYIGNQGISAHVDCQPCFEDGIVTISLLETWDMIFKSLPIPSLTIVKPLEPLSLLVMLGPARYEWTHEIPARAINPCVGPRGRRVSLTFRKVIITKR